MTLPPKPPRRRYLPNPEPQPYQALPFAALRPDQPRVHCWQVPPTNDRQHAYLLGREYAAHFLVFLQDNPGSPDHFLLARIAGDVDFDAPGAERGYWAGFFHLLELVLAQSIAQLDVFDYIDRLNTYEAALRQMMRKPPPHI
ncbi:hypothetical protein [Chromobacterium aquaticum]|uniref:Uncharacterized protein n=1 Tax=Chromobacterium aquaticum TaxID=467180 RepID=A0ABV8ZX51_9NEIS|nr:hypothetical protein [Chromobacterium aquaticum]MCD5361147.1 hypothetical protein [Chromobacterium aquaticum]